MDINIKPSITTSNSEITKLQLQFLENNPVDECGLFLTGLQSPEERKSFLIFLNNKLPNLKAPLVHVRSDSSVNELQFCIDNFNTKYFNLHGNHASEFKKSELFTFKDMMLAENSKTLTVEQMEEGCFAGICLDLSHICEDVHGDRDWVPDLQKTLFQYDVNVNHISAVRQNNYGNLYAEHICNYKTDMDYLSTIDKKYFGEYSFLELENTIQKQLEIINYIRNL